ncbi:MAG: DUF1206 domain-containing protein [Fimbriimonas sp.]
MSTVTDAKLTAHQAAREANPVIESAGRVGYAAKGVLYGLMGALAFLAATGNGGKTTDKRGVINTIADQPFGSALLIILGVCLAGYALFKIVMAVMNSEYDKPLKRVGNGVTGLIYGGFAFLAFKAAMGDKKADNSEQKAADVMSMPGGIWIIAALGLIILGVGVMQIVKGGSGKFMDILKKEEMSEDEQRTALISGRIGLISRGIVFVITGGFLLWAAKDHDPNKAGGLDQALQAIASAPYGPLLLAMTGLGLVAFCLFMFVEAKYRKFAPIR